MALVQHSVIFSQTSPYTAHYVKFVDGRPQNITEFTVGANVQIYSAAWTPDARYLFAGSSTNSTNPYRLWKRNDDDTLTSITLAANGFGSQFVYRIKWMTDTVALFVSSLGCGYAVLDRDTNTFTWTRLLTSSTFRDVAIHPAKDHAIYIGTGTLFQWATRSGESLTTQTGTFPSFISGTPTWCDFTNDGLGFIRCIVNGAAWNPRQYTGDRSLSTAGFLDKPAYNLKTAPVQIIFSKRGNKAWIRSTVNPPLRYLEFPSHPSQKRWHGFVPDATSLAANTTTDIAEILRPNDELILATRNITGAGNAVWGFTYDPYTNKYTEDVSIREHFSALIRGGRTIAVSDPTDTEGVVKLYNSATATIFQTVSSVSFKLALTSSSSVFDPTHTTLDQALDENEVYGSSWPQGGITIGGVQQYHNIAVNDTFEQQLRINTVVTQNLSAAGSLTFRNAVLYDNSKGDKTPLAFIQYETDKTYNQGDTIRFGSSLGTTFNANLVATLT